MSCYLNCDSAQSLGAAGSINTEGGGFCPEECGVKYETRKRQCEEILKQEEHEVMMTGQHKKQL